jgi:tetratricopeptide (TPR) repeat protein
MKLLASRFVHAVAIPAFWLALIGTAFAEQSSKSPATAEATADSGLTDQILYQYLISEIAGQRGRTSLALRGLMDLARKTNDPQLARRAVEVAFQARDMPAALDATTLWLDMEPNSPMARQALSALAGGHGTLEAAKAALQPLLAQTGKTVPLLMQLNSLLGRFVDKSDVLLAVRYLTSPYLALPEAHFALAVAAATAKEFDAALLAAEKAESMRPGWAQAAVLKSQILREHTPEKASEYLKQFLDTNPEANEARLAYARTLVAERAYLSAREQYRQAQKRLPADAEIAYANGLLSQQIEDFAEAESQFKRVLELKPADANPVLFNLGTVAEAQKQPAAAIDWYRQIGRGEYFVGAQLKIAGILIKRDGMAAGRKFLHEAQLAESESPETRNQLILAEAQLLRDSKAHREAFEFLSEIVKEYPDTADFLYDRAMVAEKLGKLDVMESDLRRVIELKPDNAHAYNALGYSFADRNVRLSEALDLVQSAVKLAPSDAFIQDSLGWVQFRLGRVDEALKTLTAAYEAKRDPEIAAHLGEIHWTKGNRDVALKLWKGALLENPDHEVLLAVMRKFQP